MCLGVDMNHILRVGLIFYIDRICNPASEPRMEIHAKPNLRISSN